jgi:protein-disulfide isomerase
MVEFADFECPHCAAAAPVVHSVIDSPEWKGRIRFVFKEFPLPGHEHAEPAARAALAAQAQGKFWEMHDQLFTHQETLNQPDLEGFAKKLGLDVDRFRTDMNAQALKDRVAADRALGQQIGVAGTPSIFINGRKFVAIGSAGFAEQLIDWMRLELQLMGVANGAASTATAAVSNAPSITVSGSASGSASAAPSGSTSAAPSTKASVAPSTSASSGVKGSK